MIHAIPIQIKTPLSFLTKNPSKEYVFTDQELFFDMPKRLIFLKHGKKRKEEIRFETTPKDWLLINQKKPILFQLIQKENEWSGYLWGDWE